ncbi:MAG: response regulator transcription factor [Anaerolineae bacterium]|nr:response regulator transcription factor [Anaerolineae bacterium]
MLRQPVTLVIARSAQLRESLLVLLRAIPQIEAVYQAEDGPSALVMMPQVQPALVLLDYDLPDDELRTTLSQLRTAWPKAQYVVLFGDEHNRRRAKDAGADSVLLKGIRATTIMRTIEGLLSETPPDTAAFC